MTLTIPKELYEQMKRYRELKWSEVARKAFEERLEELELADDLRSIRKAKKEHKEGRTIKDVDLARKLGLKV